MNEHQHQHQCESGVEWMEEEWRRRRRIGAGRVDLCA